jgi:hypothetical protein
VLLTVLALLFAGALGAGVLWAIGSVSGLNLDLDVDPFGEPFATPEPVPTAPTAPAAQTPVETPRPTAPPEAAEGSPHSLASLQRAWEARGIRVETGPAAAGFSGFQRTPIDVRLSRGGATATLAVFIYPTREAAQGEWNLSAESRPSPKSGTAPAYQTAWWNANVVVVVITASDGLADDARQALFGL